METRKYL